MRAGFAPAMSSPQKRIEPPNGTQIPLRLLFSVDLPTPLLPSTATTSPSATSISMPWRISTSPYPARRPRTSSMRGRRDALRRAVTEVSLDHHGVGRELPWGALRDDFPVGQHIDILGEAHHRLHHVLDEEYGDARAADALDHRDELVDFRGIQARHNLVEKQQFRLRRPRARRSEGHNPQLQSTPQPV